MNLRLPFLLWLLCLLLRVTSARRGRQREFIRGGEEAVPYEFPFIIRLLLYGSSHCGATLIGPNVALSAAHCFEADIAKNPKNWKAVVGDYAITKSDQFERLIGIKEIIIHPKYTGKDALTNGEFKKDDIVLLILEDEVLPCTNNVNTISLPFQGDNRFVSMSGENKPADIFNKDTFIECTSAGWGLVCDGECLQSEYADDLMKVRLNPPMKPSECNAFLRKKGYGTKAIVGDGAFCSYTEDKDTTEGDSGGPFFCRRNGNGYDGIWTLVGITSWSTDDLGKSPTAVYTNVAHYLPWITDEVNRNRPSDIVGEPQPILISFWQGLQTCSRVWLNQAGYNFVGIILSECTDRGRLTVMPNGVPCLKDP